MTMAAYPDKLEMDKWNSAGEGKNASSFSLVSAGGRYS